LTAKIAPQLQIPWAICMGNMALWSLEAGIAETDNIIHSKAPRGKG